MLMDDGQMMDNGGYHPINCPAALGPGELFTHTDLDDPDIGVSLEEK